MRPPSLTVLYRDFDGREDTAEALAVYEDIYRRTRRVFGANHPQWTHLPDKIKGARELLDRFVAFSAGI